MLCQKLSKIRGFFDKETLKLYHYVTMGLATSDLDLRGNFRGWLEWPEVWQRLWPRFVPRLRLWRRLRRWFLTRLYSTFESSRPSSCHSPVLIVESIQPKHNVSSTGLRYCKPSGLLVVEIHILRFVAWFSTSHSHHCSREVVCNLWVISIW